MTMPKNDIPAPDDEKATAVVAAPTGSLTDTDLPGSDHYDVSVQSNQDGDLDRVHVTAIVPRVRK